MQRGLIALVFALLLSTTQSWGASKAEIDFEVKQAIERFDKEVTGGKEFLQKAKGYLVFPSVYKAGFGVGGEYGEGALLVGGKIVGYYNTVSASFGFQIGAQKKSVIIVFLTEKALNDFRKSDGWKIGADASVALIKWGVGEDINSMDIKDPIVGFVFGNQGLMYNLTLEGTKITKIEK